MSTTALNSGLSRKQVLSIARSNARINIWDGSIRSGKTTASLMRWLGYVNTAPKGELVMVGKTSLTVHRNVFSVLGDSDIFGPLADQCRYNKGAPTGTVLGRTVHVVGANDTRSESKIRGMTVAGAYVDECTLCDQEFFTQLLGRMSVPGAQLFGTTNADSPAHWLKTEFLDRAGELDGPDLTRWNFEMADNPSLSPEYLAGIESEFTGLFYKRFVLGQWVAAQGAVFDGFDAQRMIVDQLPPIVRWISVGVDYGTTNPTHCILLGLGYDNVLYAAAEWRWDSKRMQRQLTDAEYSQKVRAWLNSVTINGQPQSIRPEFVVVDPSAASFRLTLHQDGLNPTLGNNAVGDGLRTLSTLFNAGKLKIHSSCTELLQEVPGYSWDQRAALLGEDKPLKVKDHGIDALRYAVYSTRQLWRGPLRINKLYESEV
jgi:PBSX family phage terminase large subunit